MDGRLTREELSLLLAGHGRLYSEQLGIRLDGLDRDQLFRWFLASLLFGARIFESVASRTYEAFVDHRLVTPALLAKAYFLELLQIMAEGGYVRYDNITSHKVQQAAAKLIAEYGGDLNNLHAAASGPRDLEARLQAFKGVGQTTAGIFLRELRGLWLKADPPLGGIALLAAGHLGSGGRRSSSRRCTSGPTRSPATTSATSRPPSPASAAATAVAAAASARPSPTRRKRRAVNRAVVP